jgi:glycine/D-amino acid oxidase-like deaminating enzyme
VSETAFDVVIVGGAVVGSAVAFFLLEKAPLKVLLIERDPSFQRCATTRSLASLRHQFSTPLNIAMSMFGTDFVRGASRRLAVGDEQPDLAWREAAYLFLASPAGEHVLRAAHAAQCSQGAAIAWFDRQALSTRFPWLRTDDLAAGTLGLAGEGWLDAHALMQAFRRKAIALGVQSEAGEVVALERSGHTIDRVRLSDGRCFPARWVVNAAGTGATALAASAGIALPVRARKRCVFHFRSPARITDGPLVIDPSGLYFRPEGAGFLCGAAPPEDQDPDATDFEVDWPMWEQRLWPALAYRVPEFESARLLSAWAGHYDVNLLDHNVIVGPHPEVDNLLFANGFSGHGLQQSPAIGRALAEWVVDGGYRSLDLSALGWGRVLRGEPLRELQVV